jgi:hypothetical protein
MFFLFSGEGPTDLGACSDGASQCNGPEYLHGPMTVMVDQIVEERHEYSLLATGHYGYVSEGTLSDRASELKAARKAPRLPGKKRGKETRYFFNNARVLARIAMEREEQLGDEVLAVLFRDSDGTASAGRGLWADKHQSMLDGFREEGFHRGVADRRTSRNDRGSRPFVLREERTRDFGRTIRPAVPPLAGSGGNIS